MTNPSALIAFHPVVRSWFEKAFGELSPPQRLGWPQIASRKNTLIVAPTGSGKTLAAFLWCINHLIEEDIATGHIGDGEETQAAKGTSPRKKKFLAMIFPIRESGSSTSRR